jgi:hypothetical protein
MTPASRSGVETAHALGGAESAEPGGSHGDLIIHGNKSEFIFTYESGQAAPLFYKLLLVLCIPTAANGRVEVAGYGVITGKDVTKNHPCPCGISKKYKHCCMKK